jgi:hypothetical protein
VTGCGATRVEDHREYLVLSLDSRRSIADCRYRSSLTDIQFPQIRTIRIPNFVKGKKSTSAKHIPNTHHVAIHPQAARRQPGSLQGK